MRQVDLRTIRPEYKAILQNKKIIAVDQDLLGEKKKDGSNDLFSLILKLGHTFPLKAFKDEGSIR